MEIIRQELKLVAENAPKGSHKKVAEKVGISEQYLVQIRQGVNAYTDTPENRKLLKTCIQAYRRLIRKEITKLNKI